jgi:hypothetical protein
VGGVGDVSSHQPTTQSWVCLACSLPWPCLTRRRQLLARYADSPASLALVLAAALVDACRDLPEVPAGELHAQLVGWLPSFRGFGGAW